MKKALLILAALAFILVPSCTKQVEEEPESEDLLENVGEEGGEQQGGTVEFEATLLETKTHLGNPDGSAGSRTWPNLWSSGDKINVNGVASKALNTDDGYVGTNYAKFTMDGTVSGPYYAAYPASAVSYLSAGSATITVPANQNWVEGNYDPAAYIMLGKSETTSIPFNPVMGLIQLTTTAPDGGGLFIKSITVEPVGDQSMCGTFTTDYSGITGGTASSGITISANTGSDSDATKAFGTVFTFAIPAQKYAKGIRFRITAVPNSDGTGDEQTMVFAKQSAFDISAGTLYPLTAPAFKESSITWGDADIGDLNGVYSLTSSSIQLRWNGSNASNNRNKTWRIHAYTNSTCTTEFGSGWTIPKSASSCWDETNPYLTFIVGGLSMDTSYWFKIEDVQNGVFSDASSEVKTEAFTNVEMPGSITTTGVVLAEDFNELTWGSTSCGRRSSGFRPSNTSSFSNLSTDGATFYHWDSWISFRNSALNTALSSSRLDNWMSEGDVTAHPGHVKLGTSSTAGWILTPAFPVASGKSAIVNVTLNAMKYNSSAQSEYAIAVLSSSEVGTGSGNRESSFTWPDTSDESLYQSTGSFSSASTWQSKTARGLVLKPGDRIVIGRRDGDGNTNPRLYINSVTVEVTSMCFEIKDVATLQSFMTNKPAEAIVTADINMIGQSFTTISGYTGTLYGNGHTISGLTVPMFAELQGTVRDLTLNSNIDASTSDANYGIFANKMTNSSSLVGCTAKGSLTFKRSNAFTSEVRIGGLVGYLSEGSLDNCRNEATITFNDNNKDNSAAINLGGVVGQVYLYDKDKKKYVRQYVTSCTNKGNITNNCNTTGDIYVGGVVAKPHTASLNNCKNENSSADITISNKGSGYRITVGGVFGMTQVDCIISGECYNTEAVSNTGTASHSVRIGGFVGQSDHKNTFNADSTTYPYNDGPVTEGSASSTVYVGGFCGMANNAETNLAYCRNNSNGDILIQNNTRTKVIVGGVLGISSGEIVQVSYTRNYGDITFKTLSFPDSGADQGIFAGGILGTFSSDSDETTTITHCYTEGKIHNNTEGRESPDLLTSFANIDYSYVGGIAGVGPFDGYKFEYCYTRADILLYSNLKMRVGGIVGYSSIAPENCFAYSDLTYFRQYNASGKGKGVGAINTKGNGVVGGIVGYCDTPGPFTNLTFYGGTLTTTASYPDAYGGGIVGEVHQDCSFANCNIAGKLSGSGSYSTGLFLATNGAYTISFSSCKVNSGAKLVAGDTTNTCSSDSDLTARRVIGKSSGTISAGSNGLKIGDVTNILASGNPNPLD